MRFSRAFALFAVVLAVSSVLVASEAKVPHKRRHATLKHKHNQKHASHTARELRFRGSSAIHHMKHHMHKAKHHAQHQHQHHHAGAKHATHELRFREKHHQKHEHHLHAGAHKAPALDPFYQKHLASLLEVGASPQQSQQLADNSAQSPLTQLTSAAQTIEMRFKQAEGDKDFGKGLDKSLVKDVRADSEEFWQDVRSLTPDDTQDMSQEDAQALQQVVQQVAQMDDDLNNPKRGGMVQSEYDNIKKELSDAGI